MTHDPREALEPFARIPLSHTDDIDDSATVFKYEGGAITLGDLRRVHAALTASPGEQKPVALAHVRLEDDGLFADLQVLDGTNLQPSMSPIALYLSPPPSGWDEAKKSEGGKKETFMTEDQIKYMVNRFLGWKLPANFNPDNGVSFNPIAGENGPHPFKREPSGTNLFDATQATEMVRYMIDGIPARPDAGGGVREAFVSVLASLAAAISLLERMPKAKKAAPSDTMFAIMLDDYRKALETGRAALSTPPAAVDSNASVEARLREAVNDMLGAFAEGVCWSPEQRAAYEKAAKLVSPAGGDGPDSDCATHNEPTYPNGPCNYSGPCGWKDEANESRRDDLALAAKCAGKLCDDCPPVGYETDRTRCLPCPRRTVGDEAKKSDEAAGTRPVPSVSGNSDREQQRDTTGVTAGETATPSDPTAERREIVARIIDPVAFDNIGGLAQSRRCKALAKADAILAALDGGAGA